MYFCLCYSHVLKSKLKQSAAESAKTTCELLHHLSILLIHLTKCLVGCCHDQILECLDIVRIYNLLRKLYGNYFLLP